MQRDRKTTYLYPGSNCLKNKFGIEDRDQLDSLQKQIAALMWPAAMGRLSQKRAASTMLSRTLSGKITLPDWELRHLLLVHSTLFGKLFDFAGKRRTVNIGKLTKFCDYRRIDTEAENVFSDLNRRLRDADKKTAPAEKREAMLDAITHFYGSINNVHIFREGNGRSQLLLSSAICEERGYKIDWEKLRAPNAKATFDAACIDYYNGATGDLRNILDAALVVRDEHDTPTCPVSRCHIKKQASHLSLPVLQKPSV